MKCVIQRVKKASLYITGEKNGNIDTGLVILLAILNTDDLNTVNKMVSKIVNMRIFPDENGKMNISLLEKNYSCLLVSQFTLYADCKKGNRPFYGAVADPVFAQKMYSIFYNELKKLCNCVSGIFGEDMQIELINDGPITIILDSKDLL